MIYITGDTHGDIRRFKPFKKLIPRRRNTVLVCGDFGFLWDGSKAEKRTLRRLERLDCNIMFVEGTHDNMELLKACPLEDYCGGKVRRVGKNLFWMQRGEIFTIEDFTVFAMGGGESADIEDRLPGVSWWHDEMPSTEELDHARQTLERAGNAVDLIVTHLRPRIELGQIEVGKQEINPLTALLGNIARTAQYRHWYFGGDHLDRQITPKLTAVFERLVKPEPKNPAQDGKKKATQKA